MFDGDDEVEDNLAQIQREAYYSYIRMKALNASSSSIVFTYSFMKAVYTGFTDYRKSECQIVYPLPLLILVIMMELNCGITDADAILSHYRKHCLEFYILLGDVPPLTNRLSASTIRTVMMLLDKDELEKFFLEYFSKVKLYITEQINYNRERIDSREGDIKNTIGFDGQALNATFKRGECKCSVKGADAVTMFDCTNVWS